MFQRKDGKIFDFKKYFNCVIIKREKKLIKLVNYATHKCVHYNEKTEINAKHSSNSFGCCLFLV